jgi:hypothetical protein
MSHKERSRVGENLKSLPRTESTRPELKKNIVPLAKAMIEGDVATFEACVREGADPNVEIVIDQERETLLLLALSAPDKYGNFSSASS